MLALSCLLVCLSGAPAVDSVPSKSIIQLVHTRWTAKDGAPTEVRALAQTTDGYLWLGTLSGLVRFDGVRFVPVAPAAGDTIPSGGVRRLLASPDGSLWIVWRGGTVSHIDKGRVRSYGEQDGLPVTYHLTESSTGTLVAGTAKGLARFTDGRWKEVGSEWGYPGGTTRSVWYDRADALWAMTPDRIVYLPSTTRQFIDPGMRLMEGPIPAEFAEAKDGTVWMTELSRSVHTLHRLGEQGPISEVKVGSLTLLIDRTGALWIGSAGDGLRRIVNPAGIRGRTITQFGAEAETFTERDGLLSDLIYALLEDRDGNIWVATGRGIERFRDAPFTPVPTAGSVRPRWVYATRDTSVWTAAFGLSGLYRIGPRDQDSILTTFLAVNLFQDLSGGIWVAEKNKVMRLEGRRFTAIPLVAGAATAIDEVTVDPAGTLWAYDQDLGLLQAIRDTLVPVAALHQPISQHSSLFSDGEGRIWVAQTDRVALYDRGRLRLFGIAQGIGHGIVNSIYQDRAGKVWAAGEGGLSRFGGDRFHQLSLGNAIPGRAVFALAEDDAGGWWLANQMGVLQLPPGELERALADSAYPVRYRRYDQLDGLPGVVTHATWGAALTRGADGRIWVATDSGVASADPRRLRRSHTPPALIEAVRIDGRDMALSAVAIPPESGDLEIDYTASNLSIPERVQFRYRLDGADREWHEVGTRRRAYYTGLAPGTYHFQVMASAEEGLWEEAATVWSFRVLPAWYQTLWFRGGVVLLIVGLSAAVAARIQRGKHLRAQGALTGRYEATLAERARIAQDLHDTLLQGFAGVSMQLKAAERALPDEPDVAAQTLIHVQQLTRETLREARERVLDLHEPDLGTDDLAGALEANARRMIATTGIEFSLATTGVRRRLPRVVEVAAIGIGREAIANAVKHARARRIAVAVDFGPSLLRLEVRDDGIGFTTEQGEQARRQGHLGLSGMRTRAEHAGGSCTLQSGPEGGTVVAVELPC